LNGLPEEIQQAWEADLVEEAEPLRKDGCVRLGGVTMGLLTFRDS
jgi:hypothetical protein